MKPFDKLPKQFVCNKVKPYYDILYNKRFSLALKRACDLFLGLIIFILLIIPMIIISVAIKLDSKGPVFYKQERVTKYGKFFNILKFRTMVVGADRLGSLVTADGDSRITKIGSFLRKYRLDELPQILNVLSGNMSIVGTRPEVSKYVNQYEPEYFATLLMPAGITSLASIKYKDEDKLLSEQEDIDKVYIEQILPEKMKYNLTYVKNFGFRSDIKLMLKTVIEVIK